MSRGSESTFSVIDHTKISIMKSAIAPGSGIDYIKSYHFAVVMLFLCRGKSRVESWKAKLQLPSRTSR